MLAWAGLRRYSYEADADRLAHRWLHMIALIASRHGGLVAEKYDVIDRTLGPPVAYGNVGSQFESVPDGGFGWTNASFQVGMGLLSTRERSALNRMWPPEWVYGQ